MYVISLYLANNLFEEINLDKQVKLVDINLAKNRFKKLVLNNE
jgi:hypothetical protein